MAKIITTWDDLTPDQQRSFINYFNNKKKIKRKPDRFGNPVRLFLNFEEVRDIWLASGQINNRGTKKGSYCFSRVDDRGDYFPHNSYVELAEVNAARAKLYRASAIKGRTSPTKGMKMPTEKCPHCAGTFPNSARRHHVGGNCIMKGHRVGHSGTDHPS